MNSSRNTKSALELIRENKLTKDKRLDLGRCGLTHLPSELSENVWLETLILSDTWWGEELNALKRSKNAGDPNCIASIEGIQNLKSLKRLVVSKINLEDEEVALKHVKQWPLNDLTPISGLEDLEHLDCMNTKVSDLWPLAKLKKLRKLDCYATLIKDVSPIAWLENLQQLDCTSTLVNDISPLIPFLEKGIQFILGFSAKKSFCFEDCPLSIPPIEIIAQGKFATLNYFKEREGKNARQLREAKLLILGEPGAGKTTFARKFEDINAVLPRLDETTRGIGVHPIQKVDGDEAFTVYLWDFGGQHIYYATHRFFLTKRSLWVLVSDNRRENTDFKYWLHMAELYGEYSPLYIVINLSDNRPSTFHPSKVKGFNKIVSGVSEANLDTNDESGGLDRSPSAERITKNTADTKHIFEVLIAKIKELPHVATEWPLAWFNIREELLRIKKGNVPFISLERYFQICEKFGLQERDRKLYLAAFLHDLGVILHFSEGALGETIFLNMKWVTDGVFMLYDSPLINSGTHSGVFQHEDVAKIWSGSQYMEKQAQLLALMAQFKLCYQVNVADKFIIPDLLPIDEPDYSSLLKIEPIQALERGASIQYKYHFMPKGIFGRLAVELNWLIASIQQCVWREGMILQIGDTFAKITEKYDDRKIVVRASGPHRKELMAIVTSSIEKINGEFPKLQIKKRVPCYCDKCRQSKKPFYYSFGKLIERLNRGTKKIECGESEVQMDVLRLLGEEDGFEIGGMAAKIFITFSEKDKEFLDRLLAHLRGLERNKLADVWHERRILPGSIKEKAIREELETADIIVLLISANLISDDNIWGFQLKEAFSRFEKGKVKLIPVLLSNYDLTDTPLKGLTTLPSIDNGVVGKPDNEEAWLNIAKGVRDVINSMGRQ